MKSSNKPNIGAVTLRVRLRFRGILHSNYNNKEPPIYSHEAFRLLSLCHENPQDILLEGLALARRVHPKIEIPNPNPKSLIMYPPKYEP